MDHRVSSPPAPLLLAEDEESDAIIFQRAWTKKAIANTLVVARNGQEVIDYLTGSPPFEDRARYPMPGLLILDLKMPRKSGFDVLSWLSTRPGFAQIPVVVLTSSSAEADMRRAREMGAREYFVKPNDSTGYAAIVQRIYDLWLTPATTGT
jgi:CheY-like chemotaxis protein